MPWNSRILIVDDEPVIANTLSQVFAREGCEARAALSAEEAIELIREWQPDKAIIDIRLGAMNGVEFALRLMETYPSCQTTLLSGVLDLTDAVAPARDLGYDFLILQKPIHPRDLLTLIANRLSNAIEFQGRPLDHGSPLRQAESGS